MVALLLSLTGALIIGLVNWVPGLIGQGSGVDAIQPGLMVVKAPAVGVITLGDGRSVSLDGRGMRVRNGTETLFQTPRAGSPISALRGSVKGAGADRSEQVEQAWSDVRFDRVVTGPGSAEYSGVVLTKGADLPFTFTVALDGDWIRMAASVDGADAVVVHSAEEPGMRGVPPALPDQPLRGSQRWLDPDIAAGVPAYRTAPGAIVVMGPVRTDRAIDADDRGRLGLHVWGPRAEVVLASRLMPQGSA